MKRLFYLLAIVLFAATFTSCSTGEELDEMTIQTSKNALSETSEKEVKPISTTHQPGREEVKPKSPF